MKKTHQMKHNKKRNTAFLYEVLIQDVTRSVMSGDDKRRQKTLRICKEFFKRGSVLYKEKELYRTLAEGNTVAPHLREKLLTESKKEYAQLNKREIFNTQTQLINKVNKDLSPNVFSNFVSNYKSLATISQILRQSLSVKKRIILENSFVESLGSSTIPSEEGLEPTDNLVYKTFINSYNQKYETDLLEEQKEIITRYATTFSDNGLSLKVYLNEELGRLKKVLGDTMETDLLREDDVMVSKTQEVLNILESYRVTPAAINDDAVVQILEIQRLAKEMES